MKGLAPNRPVHSVRDEADSCYAGEALFTWFMGRGRTRRRPEMMPRRWPPKRASGRLPPPRGGGSGGVAPPAGSSQCISQVPVALCLFSLTAPTQPQFCPTLATRHRKRLPEATAASVGDDRQTVLQRDMKVKGPPPAPAHPRCPPGTRAQGHPRVTASADVIWNSRRLAPRSHEPALSGWYVNILSEGHAGRG